MRPFGGRFRGRPKLRDERAAAGVACEASGTMQSPLEEAIHGQGDKLLAGEAKRTSHALPPGLEPEGSRIFGMVLTRGTDAGTGSQGPGERRQGPPVHPPNSPDVQVGKDGSFRGA